MLKTPLADLIDKWSFIIVSVFISIMVQNNAFLKFKSADFDFTHSQKEISLATM